MNNPVPPKKLTDFFTQTVEEYDALIRTAIPRYDEIFWAMFYYLPEDFQPKTILELGCGTGNLTRLLHQRWPESPITVVDISADMLKQTQERLPNAHLTSIESMFETLNFPSDQFDLIMASFSIHHILNPDKAALFQKIAHWLFPGGFFVIADVVKSSNDRLHQADIQYLEHLVRQQGASETHLHEWADHRLTLDHYATLPELTDWLTQTGFTHINTLWRYLYNIVLQAQKPHHPNQGP